MENVEHRQSSTENSKAIDAGIIIIGDEILKGHCKDTNASYLLSQLWSNGVTVRKVSFISDNPDEIAKEVSEFSSKYSFVITTGGIGPTHDDMTFEAIANAFNDTIVLNTEIEKMIKEFCGNDLSPAALKMAMVPSKTVISLGMDPITNMPQKYPLLSVNNVFIFPGIPEYLKKLFIIHKDLFTGNGKFLLIKVYLCFEEEQVAGVVENISNQFPTVHVGSYPMLSDAYKVKITLESEDASNLTNAYTRLIADLPKESIISVEKCSPNSREADGELRPWRRNISISQMNSVSLLDIQHFLSSNNTSSLGSAIKCAWSVFNQVFQIYSFDEVCIGFNGGKDCTVILHLYVAFIKKVYPSYTNEITALYIRQENPFEEAEHFIESCQLNYNIEMLTIPGSIRGGLTKLSEKNNKIKLVIMGTRRHDPFSIKLRSFTMTDSDWPKYMRAFPILDWSYAEVWNFLRTFDLPYCPLYDEGYTSLGCRINTEKNPSLRQSDGSYLPAYTLCEEQMERAGRGSK